MINKYEIQSHCQNEHNSTNIKFGEKNTNHISSQEIS